MHRLITWVQFFVVVHLAALAVRAERLEAVWIGPGGAGGEGDWHTPSNWNLGVVPDNGIDANGDGVPDIFDVRIDRLPGTISVVRSDEPPVEIAGLTVDEGDILELKGRFGFLLRDSDAVVDLVNKVIRGF